MGQYYKIVNLDKKEYIRPHAFNDGAKLLEFGSSGEGTMTALAILLANSNGRGGGDLHVEDNIIGHWAGDRIVIAGDYAEKRDRGEAMNKKENLYHRCETEFADISISIIRAMAGDNYLKQALRDRKVLPSFEPEVTVHNNKEFLTVATFRSKRSGEEYKVKESYNLLEGRKELTCNCKGWIFNKTCKHIKHVVSHNIRFNEEPILI